MLQRKPSWRNFLVVLAACVIGVLGIALSALWALRSEMLAGSFQVSALMARSFEHHLTQSLNATTQAATQVLAGAGKATDRREVEADFKRMLRGAPHLRSLSLINADDRIVASSNPANVGRQVPTGDYLPVIQGRQTVLRLGEPWVGRDFADGQALRPGTAQSAASTLIAATVPLQDASGQLRLLVALNPDHLVNLMSQQLDWQTGLAEVLRLDGTRLLSTDPDHRLGGTSDNQALARQFQELEFGQLEDDGALGQPALTAFRVSPLYPFAVVTHLRRDVALQRWMAVVTTVLGVLMPVLVALSVLAVGFHRRQMALEAQRLESERLQRINAACVFTNIREGILITQADATITDVNDAFVRITGYSRDEVLGQNPRLLSSGRQDKAFYEAMWRELLGTGHWRGEIWNRRKDGEVFAEMLTISAVPDSRGQVQQYVAIFNNITDMKAYQSELEHIARFDPLTDLPNRLLLDDRLRQAMNQAQRRRQLLAVVFIDLDGFKAINDNFGHEAGDQVLITLSSRLRAVLRDSDTLARQGGDEFVALLADLPTQGDAMPTLHRLLEAAALPMDALGHSVQVSASIGVSFYPQAGKRTADELLHQADLAMYQAKAAGKNRIQLWSDATPQVVTTVAISPALVA